MPLVPSHVAYIYLPLKLWDQFSVPLLPDIHDLMVFTDMEFKNDDVHGIGFHVPFAQFTQFAPRPSTQARNAPSRRGKVTDIEIVRLLQLEYPWLTMEEIQQLLKAKTPAAGAGSSSTPSSRSSAVAPIIDEEPFMVPEDMVAAVAAELESVKSQLETFKDENACFKTRVLGGQWSARFRLVPATDIGAYPKFQMVENMCKLVSWPVARLCFDTFWSRKPQAVCGIHVPNSFFLCSRGWTVDRGPLTSLKSQVGMSPRLSTVLGTMIKQSLGRPGRLPIGSRIWCPSDIQPPLEVF